MRTFTIFLIATTGLSFCGCSTEGRTPTTGQNDRDAGTSGDGSCAFDYTNYQPQSAPLTLRTDILPIIARSCAISTACHRTGTAYSLSLGPGIVDGMVVATDMVVADTSMSLAMASAEVPDWSRVKGEDPEHSYLLRKLDGSERCGDLACVVVLGSPKPCGERMPGGDSATPLDPGELTMIRDWIKQGAN